LAALPNAISSKNHLTGRSPARTALTRRFGTPQTSGAGLVASDQWSVSDMKRGCAGKGLVLASIAKPWAKLMQPCVADKPTNPQWLVVFVYLGQFSVGSQPSDGVGNLCEL
jgi:hypothetical protein